jgi:elongator complex protein 3
MPARDYTQLPELPAETFLALKEGIERGEFTTWKKISQFIFQTHKLVATKDELGRAFAQAVKNGKVEDSVVVRQQLRSKPTRTLSGVVPVTVLTKPFPCPGKCIFCPNDIRMPKSYLSQEPGAQRASHNFFDPYLQTYNRLQAFANTGHSTDKVELIILGGTWSYYPEEFQRWFIWQCFQAMNDFGAGLDQRDSVKQTYQKVHELFLDKSVVNLHEVRENKYNRLVSEEYVAPERKAGLDKLQTCTWEELEAEQRKNETSACRNVGLVIETRPDNISIDEVMRIRRLGCTKTQIGIQSLNDEVLTLNNRGHDVAATRQAFRWLRQAGFKIHAHWMPNLYGSTPEKDKEDFAKLFADPDFHPDELKIYPCSLIETAELMEYYQRGQWQPYSHEELLDVLTFCLAQTPRYCRLTRVIRDIPSTDIVVGNKLTNFREIAQRELGERGEKGQDIRAREIRGQTWDPKTISLRKTTYETSVSTEVFLEYVTPDDALLGFLRLSLPTTTNPITELADAAIIREVHVYGLVTALGHTSPDRPQHLGLGTKLIDAAKSLTKDAGFAKLAVISAIGTREYYRGRGFTDGVLYQHWNVS